MRLYALCDQDMLDRKGVSVEKFVEIAKQNKAEIIQYRAKNEDLDFIKQQLIQIRKIYDGFLIINDRYELSEFCDGVHLGQEDLQLIDKDFQKAIKILRHVIGNDKIIGVSTHNEDEILMANNVDINYVGLGAYRATTTKQTNNILGEKLDKIASLSKHPVGAIGGVRQDDKFLHVTYHVIGSALL